MCWLNSEIDSKKKEKSDMERKIASLKKEYESTADESKKQSCLAWFSTQSFSGCL
jgi:hypothetical protein